VLHARLQSTGDIRTRNIASIHSPHSDHCNRVFLVHFVCSSRPGRQSADTPIIAPGRPISQVVIQGEPPHRTPSCCEPPKPEFNSNGELCRAACGFTPMERARCACALRHSREMTRVCSRNLTHGPAFGGDDAAFPAVCGLKHGVSGGSLYRSTSGSFLVSAEVCAKDLSSCRTLLGVLVQLSSAARRPRDCDDRFGMMLVRGSEGAERSRSRLFGKRNRLRGIIASNYTQKTTGKTANRSTEFLVPFNDSLAADLALLGLTNTKQQQTTGSTRKRRDRLRGSPHRYRSRYHHPE